MRIFLLPFALGCLLVTQASGQTDPITIPAQVVIVPVDLVALIQVTLTGIATLASAFAGVYAVVAATRAGRAEIASSANSKTIDQLERNTNSMSKTIENLARKEGIIEGKAAEKAIGDEVANRTIRDMDRGVQAERATLAAVLPTAPVAAPVPVADDRVAAATERSAEAAERSADAAEEKNKA